MATPKDIFDKAYELANILNKLKSLAENQERLERIVETLNERILQLESKLEIARAEIRLEVVKEAQGVVNTVHTQLIREIMILSRKVDSASALGHEGDEGERRGLPPSGKENI